jgi:hypothetical protein
LMSTSLVALRDRTQRVRHLEVKCVLVAGV